MHTAPARARAGLCRPRRWQRRGGRRMGVGPGEGGEPRTRGVTTDGTERFFRQIKMYLPPFVPPCVACRAVPWACWWRAVPCRAVPCRACGALCVVRARTLQPSRRARAGRRGEAHAARLLACLIRCTRGHVPLGPSGVGPWPGCSPPCRRAPCAQVPPWRPVRPRPPFHCRAGGRRHDRGRLAQGRRRGLQGGPPRRTP